jgi:signal transduction histidine kinase/CheY-like chemotaxis protein/HAMP domain-containing protein
MRLRDLKIGVQLQLGISVLLMCVVGLGAVAWLQTAMIFRQVELMYQHPLQVRRAIGALRSGMMGASLAARKLATARGATDVAAASAEVEGHVADVSRELDILSGRYLGSPADILALRNEYATWKASLEESILLQRLGKNADSAAWLARGGVGDAENQAMMSAIDKVDAFARDKADQFYADAGRLNGRLRFQLVVILAAIVLLSVGVSYLLWRGVKRPLSLMTAVAREVRQGHMEARAEYAAGNEFGVLSDAFNAMLDALRVEMSVKEQGARLSDVIARETDAHSFFRGMLQALMECSGSQIGAVYVLNSESAEYVRFETIGLGAGGQVSFSAAAPEGEFGAAVATRRIQRIAEIPEDTPFTFAGVSGEFRPREILTIPLIAREEAVAIISLASLRGYSEEAWRLVQAMWGNMSARAAGVLAHRKIEELAGQLELQNGELEAQQKELTAQTNELSMQNAELEAQKRQLAEAGRLKSAFLSKMSHELRTPLNSVIALSGVLQRRLAGTVPEEEYGFLEVILRNGRHLLALINDILDLSRIEAGREEVNAAEVSVQELVAEVVSMIEPQAREKGLALINLADGGIPKIASDPGKCRQILINLVGNAVKFTESGLVEVSTRHVDGVVSVAVRDTGIGIAPEHLPHIFDEFRQADDSAARRHGGTGLGLAIASKHAAMLGGAIRVDSAPGKGSTFVLELPLRLDNAGAAAFVPLPGNAARPAAAGNGRGRSILLVEDSEPALVQIGDILTRNGYRVEVARSGREALERIGQVRPDGLILDLMMPEMDGFEVLQFVRAMEPFAHLPVLILTARHVTKEELSFLKGNHVYQLIQKGDVNGAELVAAVAGMMNPVTQQPAASHREPPRERLPGRPAILVVEDNADNRRTMRALLQDFAGVLEAADGIEGVARARRERPDLILMDLDLPGIDGFSALAAIREDESLRRIPVIAVTASATSGDFERVRSAGFDAYIAKPVDGLMLLEKIDELMEGRRHEDTGYRR